MYKIISCDLDESLLDDNRNISVGNMEAIRKIREHGIKLVPNTGRTPGYLGDLYEQLDVVGKKQEYSILGNGALVIENATNKIIFFDPFPNEMIDPCFEFGMKHDLCIQIYLLDKVHFFNCNDYEYEKTYDWRENSVYHKDLDLSFIKGKKVIKMLYERKDMPYLRSLATKESFQNIVHNKLTYSFSSNRYLELNALGMHKGIGLEALAKHLNVKISDTIGMGDNLNDMGLLKTAGLGVAVSNAVDELKDLADVITKDSNNEAPLKEIVEKYVLI